MRGRGYAELPQHFPRPGWVEHDPEEIWQSVLAAAEQALVRRSARPPRSGSRTSARRRCSGTARPASPVHRAIVWQDRRTAERCAELPAELIRERTGLVPDPYFSATKLEWLLARARRRRDLAFGTVDSWLVWKLTGGRVHATDETNASRTLLCSLETLDWDDELLALFGVRRELLPEIRPSGAHFGEGELLGRTLPIQGIAGDQQAALFAARRREGDLRHRLVRPRRDRRSPPGTASCAPPPRGSSTRSRAARSRAPSSSPARRSSGCATGCT